MVIPDRLRHEHKEPNFLINGWVMDVGSTARSVLICEHCGLVYDIRNEETGVCPNRLYAMLKEVVL